MKYRYSLDNHNQLIITPPGNKKPVVAAGEFFLGESNQLIYLINEPSFLRREYALAQKIIFKGKWQLDANCDLAFMLEETEGQYQGDRLEIKGEIISQDSDTLVFELTSLDKQGQSHIQLLRLSGFWQADEYNRISFVVARVTAPDMLILEGAWQLNRNQQIVYTYEKTDLIRKTKTAHYLIFKGFWQINRANRLTYIFEHGGESRFDFRAQLESPNLYPKEGVIKYRLGIGLSINKGPIDRLICLYGSWKFGRKSGVVFQIDYGRGKIQGIEFGLELTLTQRDKIRCELKNAAGEPLGISITLTHKFLKQNQAEAFLRLRELIDHGSAIEAGFRIPF